DPSGLANKLSAGRRRGVNAIAQLNDDLGCHGRSRRISVVSAFQADRVRSGCPPSRVALRWVLRSSVRKPPERRRKAGHYRRRRSLLRLFRERPVVLLDRLTEAVGYLIGSRQRQRVVARLDLPPQAELELLQLVH